MIYTRNSVCSPIRAEEGIAGVLCPPNSQTSFRDLPEDQHIGGYPSAQQLSRSEVDAVTLDSEGRCVILEFPAFVLFGVYSPANSSGTRDDFRLGFLELLDARIRNLVKAGKRVVLTGDINVSREELDTAAAEESMRKNGMSGIEYCSTPARRLFNQLLVGGKVFGGRDEGREQSILWDTTRGFHPGRKGMFTCWEQKINARPGNYGSRIDYICCTMDMKDWFSDANIQEGLMGSDHCPVYAVMKDEVEIDGVKKHLLDIMNPDGMFKGGERKKEWSMKNLLPMSGKLIQEFDRRRSIRDMFSRKPSLQKEQSSVGENATTEPSLDPPLVFTAQTPASSDIAQPAANNSASSPPKSALGKRSQTDTTTNPPKRTKSSSTPTTSTGKGQQSLAGFFRPKSSPNKTLDGASGGSGNNPGSNQTANGTSVTVPVLSDPNQTPHTPPSARNGSSLEKMPSDQSPKLTRVTSDTSATSPLIDPIVAKESWGNLMRKPVAPLCEHEEPCKTMLTKKPGINCGRSFWMCARPLGPSGQKERGTRWRCATFIWASDWSGIEKEKASEAKDGKE